MIGILILVSVLSMLICYRIAMARRADRWYWMVMGLIFGPLAIPFVFFGKPMDRR